MSRTIGGSDAGDEWARCPASLEATPESFADRTTHADDAPEPTDSFDLIDPNTVPTVTDDETGTDAPRSSTADVLVQRAMAADGWGSAAPEEYDTFGVVGFRPEE